jgi:hypothetical protein
MKEENANCSQQRIEKTELFALLRAFSWRTLREPGFNIYKT